MGKPLALAIYIWGRFVLPALYRGKEIGISGSVRIFLSFLLLGQTSLFAENVTVTSYYPSPLGVYKNLRVTENAYLAVTSGSGVGIGTSAVTYGKLDLIATDDYGAYIDLDGTGETNAYAFYSAVSGATNNYAFYGEDGNVYVADSVGVGTTSPASGAKLHTYASGAAGLTNVYGLYAYANGNSASPNAYGVYASVSGGTSSNYSFYGDAGNLYVADSVGIGTLGTSSTAKLVVKQTGSSNILQLYDNTTTVLLVEDGGRVGIGTDNPSAQLHVYDLITDDEPTVYIYSSQDNDGELLKVYNAGDGNTAGYFYSGGTGATQRGLYSGGAGGTTNTGGYFYASGIGATNYGVNTSVTDTTGGTSYGVFGRATNIGSSGTTYGLYGYASGGATNYGLYVAAGYGYMECDSAWSDMGTYQRCTDLAEVYHSGEKIEPGDVVVLRSSDRKLFKSGKPYEDTLAGVYSTSPGMVLGSKGMENGKTGILLGGVSKMEEGEFPLALVGRVPVKVTDEGGKIQPGDRVTSSSKAGYAMKATKSGRVLGVALESFDGKEGKVLIMVNPQWWDGGEVAKLSETVSRLNEENESLKLRLDKLEKKLAAK